MTQPIARNSDPITSHLAAAELKGRLTLVERVTLYVMDHPGSVVGEIADGMGLTQYTVGKRLSDAVRKGRIYYGAPRRYNGFQQQECWPYHVSRTR